MDRFGVNTGKHEREDNRRQYRHTGHGRWQPLLSGCPRPRFPDAPWLDYHLQLEGPDGDPDQRRLAGWFRHTEARPLDRSGRSRCGARTRTHCGISHRKTRRGTMGRSPLLYPRPARKAGQHSCIGWTRVPAIISRTYLGRQARAHTTCGPQALREEVETWTALRQSCSLARCSRCCSTAPKRTMHASASPGCMRWRNSRRVCLPRVLPTIEP